MEKIGEVKTPTGSRYDVFWNSNTGEIRVGSEPAGSANTKDRAMIKADYYATTLTIMKD
jgi:hypothetical protein